MAVQCPISAVLITVLQLFSVNIPGHPSNTGGPRISTTKRKMRQILLDLHCSVSNFILTGMLTVRSHRRMMLCM